jgi:hypothetical protein
MSDCKFCNVPDIVCKNLQAYFIGLPDTINTSIFNKATHIPNTHISSSNEFQSLSYFTPGSRLDLTLEEANRLIAHRKAWEYIIAQDTVHKPYAVIFEGKPDEPKIISRIENVKVTKDWDIIKLSDNEYILTQRAAKILTNSTMQFHSPIKTLLETFEVLKIFHLNI